MVMEITTNIDASAVSATQKSRINDNIFDFLGELDAPNVETSTSGIVIVGDYLKSPKLAIHFSDEEMMINLKNQQHPAIFYPAQKYLSTPGSSVPCERLFSAKGQTVTDQRNCLGGKNIKMLIFLNQNFDLVSYFDEDNDENFVYSDEEGAYNDEEYS